MKKSRFALSIAATFALGVAVGLTILNLTDRAQPTPIVQVVGDTQPEVVVHKPESRKAYIMRVAHEVAAENHYKFPELLEAIILQESKGGTAEKYKVGCMEHDLPVTKRCYGVGQVKLATAREMLSSHPSLYAKFSFQTRTDEEILAKLIEDDRFNMTISDLYLEFLGSQGYSTAETQAVAYQAGVKGGRGIKRSEYSDGVLKKMASVSPRS